ncbi:MAG: hypothetical protein ACQEQ0_14940, partial [Bacteroidota bacterium]
PISYNESLKDTIEMLGEMDAFTFNGTSGDIINVRMRFSSDYDDPQIELYNPAGFRIASKSSTSALVSLDTVMLEDSGQYTILTMSRTGSQTGSYGISLQRTFDPPNASPIAYNESLNASIDILAEMDAFRFDGKAGDIINVQMKFSNDYNDPRLELYNPSGNRIASSSTNNSQLRLDIIKLGASGQYTIMTMANDGGQTGGYTLSLQRTFEPPNARPISYNESLKDTIEMLGEMDAFTFNGTSGDIINVQMKFSTSYNDPQIELYNPSGERIASKSAKNAAVRLDTIKLDVTGQYTILAMEKEGDQTGTYWLILQNKKELITNAELLKTENGIINVQIPQPGIIKPYSFLINKNDTTEFSIKRNSGNFQPYYELIFNDSVIYSGYNSNSLTIPDSYFQESGQYTLFISDYNYDQPGEFQFQWKGLTQNIVLISDILSHQDVYNLGDEITPKAVIKNIGWENVTAQLRLKIFETYDEKVDNITLLPGQEKTLELKNWTPFSEGSFTGIWTTENNLGYGGDFYNERFCVTDGKGPEIYSVSPETGANGGDFTLTITGKAFQAGLKAALFNDDYPSGRIAENSDINYLSSDSIEATFDLSNVPESKFHVKIINPDDSTFVFYEGFMVTQFNGKELTLNTWEEIEIAAGTQEVYGINITDQTENLFFLVKKATKIGHHGTWTGGMRVFRQGTLIADESGTQDYDFHFKNMPPGRYYIEVWSQQEAEAQIKVGDHVDKLTFGEWHKGLVLKGWGSDWTQIDVPENTDSLYFETQGFGIYSNLQIFYDSLGNKENYHYFDDYKKGNHLSGSIANPVPGRYYLKYMDSDNVVGGDSQERDYLINVDIKSIEESEPLKPIITSLSTYEGGKSDIVTITIVGSG